MQDLQDKMADQLEQQEEVNDFFADKAKEDQDELMDELNELTELDALDDLAGLDVGNTAVSNPNANVIQPKNPQPAQ